MAVTSITDTNFVEVLTNAKLAIVDFWAPWCGPCKMQGPVLDQLSERLTDVDFFKVNVDENKEKATEFGIRAIPTLLVLKDNEVVERLTGFHNAEQLIEVLNKYK